MIKKKFLEINCIFNITEILDDESPLKRITLNLRRILVAYPEGVKLPELVNAYSVSIYILFIYLTCDVIIFY